MVPTTSTVDPISRKQSAKHGKTLREDLMGWSASALYPKYHIAGIGSASPRPESEEEPERGHWLSRGPAQTSSDLKNFGNESGNYEQEAFPPALFPFLS